MINVYEKQSLLHEAILDAERRLGSYIANEGCEKSDKYAQDQIKRIREWSEELHGLYMQEPESEGN